MRERLPEALEWYRRCTNLAPRYPDVHINMAAALRSTQKPLQAAEAFRMALEIAPGDALAEVNLSLLEHSNPG